MAKGFKGVRDASEELEQRRQAGSGSSALWFKLPDSGDTAVVRFLDDDPTWAYFHEVPVEGRAWGDDIACLDQEQEGIDCPGCEADLKRKFKGFTNLIWEEAPVFKRDSEGKIVKDRTGDVVISGHKTQVAVWASGIRLFENLDEVNSNYKGLTSRRFRVKRKGVKLDTTYVITPEDTDGGPQKMTKSEKKLAESDDVPDLTPFVTPPDYEEFEKRITGGGGGSGGRRSSGGSKGSSSKPKNPFLKKKG